MCRSCYTVQRSTGKIFSEERKRNISNGIRQAIVAGAIMGPKVHTMDEGVFAGAIMGPKVHKIFFD
jgi:hypothetical protein